MPACDYCGETFADESAYLAHLRAAHEAELGPIDRRRAFRDEGSGSGLPTGPVVLAGVVLVVAAVIAYAAFVAGGGDDVEFQSADGASTDLRTPTGLGSVHLHGTIEMTVDGEAVDFSRDRYQLQADAFHFESREGGRWHVHARGVTLAWAMATLGIEVTDSSVAFDGRTYRDGAAGVEVTVEVDGEPVSPRSYVLREGDHVRIVVES